VQYSTVQYSVVQFSTVQYSVVQYSVVQHSEVLYSVVEYSVVQYLIVSNLRVLYERHISYKKILKINHVQVENRFPEDQNNSPLSRLDKYLWTSDLRPRIRNIPYE
jgi:hypothetical protein